MGANMHFDKMVPTISGEADGATDPMRQLELLSLGGKVFLRIGPVNERDSGVKHYTVELSSDSIRELSDALALASLT